MVKIILPEAFVLLSIGGIDHNAEAMFQIFLKISLVNITVRYKSDPLAFSLQQSSPHLQVANIKLAGFRPDQGRPSIQFKLDSLPCSSHFEASVFINIESKVIEDFVGCLNYFVLTCLNGRNPIKYWKPLLELFELSISSCSLRGLFVSHIVRVLPRKSLSEGRLRVHFFEVELKFFFSWKIVPIR